MKKLGERPGVGIMKGIFFVIILGSIAGAMVFNTDLPATAAPYAVVVDPAIEQHILQSTIQIGMFDVDEVGTRGLGTVVRHDGRTLIVTHDHWSYLNGTLHQVEFRNAAGGLMLVLDAAEFRSLIQYRDGGTMVMAVPNALAGFVPASLAAPGVVEAGDSIWMARRKRVGNRTTVEVIGAKVNRVVRSHVPAYLEMVGGEDGAVIPGDSGGGVWMDGRFVANVWSGGVVVDMDRRGEVVEAKGKIQTNRIHAALSPLVDYARVEEVDADSASFDLEMKLFWE
jgi:hypothetical protein